MRTLSSKPWQHQMRSRSTTSRCRGAHSSNVIKVLRGALVSGVPQCISSEHSLVFDPKEVFFKVAEDTEWWWQDNKLCFHHRALPGIKNVCWSDTDIKPRWSQRFGCSVYVLYGIILQFWGKARLTFQAQLSTHAALSAQFTTLCFLFNEFLNQNIYMPVICACDMQACVPMGKYARVYSAVCKCADVQVCICSCM